MNWAKEVANKNLHNTIDCTCDSKSDCIHRKLEKSTMEFNKSLPEVREAMKREFLSLSKSEQQKKLEELRNKIQLTVLEKEMWEFELKEHQNFLNE